MKVLLVHDFYQTLGGEDAVALAEKQLLETRVDRLHFYERRNVEINDYGLAAKMAFPIHTVYSRRTKSDMTDIAEQFRPDFAYIHNVFPLISPSLYHTLSSLKIPMLQVLHDFRFFCPNGWFYTKGQICERCKHGNYLNAVRYRCLRDSYLLSALYSLSLGANRVAGMLKKIDAIICLTEFSRQKLIEIGIPEQKLHIKPNFIDPAVTSASPGRGHYVLYLGRLSSEKGLWTLVQGFERLPAVSLKIMGGGPLEISLRKYIEERGIKNIELVGFKQGSEKWKILRESLFVVVPSEWYETFCMAALEAFAAGKPVVASNLGSLPYVIEDGKSGILFESGNVDDLIEKVNHLLANPSDIAAMGIYARGLAEMKYSPGRSYETLLEIASKVQ
jgi:glycosyltransferase involved in cell wall biosynthesis